jgi:hypothetical protein
MATPVVASVRHGEDRGELTTERGRQQFLVPMEASREEGRRADQG